MAVPEKIPIAHQPGSRTDAIGHYAHGQFFGAVTYGYPESFQWPAEGDGWRDVKRLYTVLHRFDFDGHHTGSDIRLAGTVRQQLQESDGAPDSIELLAWVHLTELLDALPGREYRDIEIRPFHLVVDDVVFELIVLPADPDDDIYYDRAELYPQGLGFREPWDGDYDT